MFIAIRALPVLLLLLLLTILYLSPNVSCRRKVVDKPLDNTDGHGTQAKTGIFSGFNLWNLLFGRSTKANTNNNNNKVNTVDEDEITEPPMSSFPLDDVFDELDDYPNMH